MKLQIITAFVNVVWFTGFAVTVLGTITAGFSAVDFLLTRVFRQCKAWVWIVDYFIHRRRFKAWLKSRQNAQEHAPPPLSGEGKETEELHGGCCVSPCSESLFLQGWWIVRGAWRSGGWWYRLGLAGFGSLFLLAGLWMLVDFFWGVGNPLK